MRIVTYPHIETSEKDIGLIRSVLMSQAENASGRPIEILEWGAGGSTVYFPKQLHEAGVKFHWTAFEYNMAWYENVLASIPHEIVNSVELKLFPTEKPMEEPMDGYVNYPFKMGKRFDFIYVDGRKRRRCLITASKLLAPHGVVMLHDVRRTYYHSAFTEYNHGQIIGDDLWIGRIDIR